MRGFIHVIEIIIISLVLLLLVSQFANIPQPTDDWNRVKVNLLTNDVLTVLNELNSMGLDGEGSFNWLNSVVVGEVMAGIMGNAPNIQYSITVENATDGETLYTIPSAPIELRNSVSRSIPAVVDKEDYQLVWVRLTLGSVF